MKPVVPTPKRSKGFTIESLIGRDSPPAAPVAAPTKCPLPRAGGLLASRIPLPYIILPSCQRLLNADKAGHFVDSFVHPTTLMGADGSAGMGALHDILPQVLPGHSHLHPPLYPYLLEARDSLSLHPCLAGQHGSCVGLQYHGHPEAELLLHPFRKPKRIRTAFSPTQLLRLEHAFEQNHYVVGQERKDLASKLSLSETQVKVWFQNRRTKFKRMKAEERCSSPKEINGSASINMDEVSHDSGSQSEEETINVEIQQEDDEEELEKILTSRSFPARPERGAIADM